MRTTTICLRLKCRMVDESADSLVSQTRLVSLKTLEFSQGFIECLICIKYIICIEDDVHHGQSVDMM